MVSSYSSYSQASEDDMLDIGDVSFKHGDPVSAALYYNLVLEKNENNVKAQFMVGRCYLKTDGKKQEAITFLKRAEEIDKEVHEYIDYFVAEGYRFNNDFENAIVYYKKFIEYLQTVGDEKSKRNIKRAEQKIKACESANSLIQNRVNIELVDFGTHVNTNEDEYAPALSADENILIFTG